MVCTADDLRDWKDFPKGLRVLLLEEDITSATEIRSKLEEMDYAVSTFYNENEALLAISDDSKGFHVAIVEVSEANSGERFKFLETTKDLPTIMISDVNCLSTMMKCIALGAVEFLKKPLSEDKLRNLWQHVAHKAFNAGKDLSESLKPIKESVASILQLQLVKKEPNRELTVETACDSLVPDNVELSAGSDKYPAPSTPQIKQGVRLLDDGDCQDQANVSTEKESLEQDGESKSVETTCDNLVTGTTFEETTHPPQWLEEESVVKLEDKSAGGTSKSESYVSSHPSNKACSTDFVDDGDNSNKALGPVNSHGTKSSRRKVKVKVDWTPELHKKFVQAVEQLGVDQAIPSRILELMNVEGLTRHNVASHLQKYRIQRRHILPKENVRRWPNPNSMTRNYYPHKPVMAYPPYHHSNHALPSSQTFPGWVPPGSYPPYMWGPLHFPTWQSTESWQYNYPVMHADAWGCPMLPPPVGPCPSFPQAEEVLDKVVKDAISKPWLPLPLGLKPPSTESVLTELTKQGISTIPPCVSDTQPR